MLPTIKDKFRSIRSTLGSRINVQEHSTTIKYVAILLASILVVSLVGWFVIWRLLPYIRDLIMLRGGTSVQRSPVSLNKEITVKIPTSNNGLSDASAPSYGYCVSFWMFVNSSAPNTNNAYSEFVSVVNHENRPGILYKGDTNELMVVVRNEYNQTLAVAGQPRPNHQDRIICVHKKVPMQKWISVLINYSGGTMDVFIDGVLIKTAGNVVPYTDGGEQTTTIGRAGGIGGGVRDVVYFDHPVSHNTIQYLSHSSLF